MSFIYATIIPLTQDTQMGLFMTDATLPSPLPEPWRSRRVTVVLPTYNEVENLPTMVGDLFGLNLDGLHILVADDNSPDGTGKLAEELAETHGEDRMTVLHRPGKQGLGRAYVDGITRAIADGAEFVVQMDSDLSHPVEVVPQMLGVLHAAGADVVIGSRYVIGGTLSEDWQLHRRALSTWANLYVRVLLGMRIRDVTSGFKMWRASTLNKINLGTIYSDGYSFQVEMHHRAVHHGLRIIEIPIHFKDRRDGTSKMSLKVQLESAWMPFKLRRRAK
jgi:dolichol-phosphate mannosyltransferase